MSQIGQVYFNVAGESSIETLANNVVTQVGASKFTKVGIQAPPGTQIVMNKIKNILIGRTGIYELDEGIDVTELYFIDPVTYSINEEGTKKNQEEGKAMMDAAVETRAAAIAGLTPEDTAYQTAEIQYLASLQEGYSKYISKVYDATVGTLHDVIIDYIWE